MTTATTLDTPPLADRVNVRLAELDRIVAAALEPNHPEGERAYAIRFDFMNRRAALASAFGTVNKTTAEILKRQPTLDDLTKAKVQFEQELAECEARPADEKRKHEHWQRELALRNSLKALCFGIEYFGSSEMVPGLLYKFLQEEGWHCDPAGHLWRGSISSVAAKIEELEQRRDEALAKIEKELAAAV